MTVTKPTLWLALLLLLVLGGCKIVSDKELAAENAKSAGAFDATAYVKKVWTPTAVTDFKTRAVDLATLLPAIEAGLEKAGQTYGRGGGEGNPWTYEVKGEGKVAAVDVKSRHGLMTVDIATKSGPRQVDLQIGPVIFGTALRDSLPFIHFGDFVNQILVRPDLSRPQRCGHEASDENRRSPGYGGQVHPVLRSGDARVGIDENEHHAHLHRDR